MLFGRRHKELAKRVLEEHIAERKAPELSELRRELEELKRLLRDAR